LKAGLLKRRQFYYRYRIENRPNHNNNSSKEDKKQEMDKRAGER
jgi:hypothetical protein